MNTKFFQSKEWAVFNEKFFKRKTWVLEEKGSYSLVIKYHLPFGKNYLYVQCGPVLESLDRDLVNGFLKKVSRLAKSENSVFLRIEPRLENFIYEDNVLSKRMDFESLFVKDLGFVIPKEQRQPEVSFVVDLDKSDEEILKSMHHKGRYNIKVAKKHNVKITKTDDFDSADFKVFLELLAETTKRNKFFANSSEYYKNLLKHVPNCFLYSAYKGDKIVASAIVVFYNNIATYYYGASSNQYRNIMAPYLLQWQMLRDARDLFSCKFYDFLGVAPNIIKEGEIYKLVEGLREYSFSSEIESKKFLENHKYFGITSFKTKFGGDYVYSFGALDKVYDKFWYKVINISKGIRRFLRRAFV